MISYKPISVVLPDNLLGKRVIPYPIVPTKLQRSLEDVDTVFYDVFITRSPARLVCIGPRLYNLRRELFPLVVVVNGKKTVYRYYQIQRLCFLESMPLDGQLSESIDIEFRFRNFTKCVYLNHSSSDLIDSNDQLLTISTLQKDNEPEWVRDWILWHRRLHDVRRVVLYDNGSSNLVQLMESLRSLEPEVIIIFVFWPFPHGIAPLKSAQHGSLNHCRLKFPALGGYCINLDIDEYLVNSTKLPLIEYLNRNLRSPTPSTVVFNQKAIANALPDESVRKPRFFHFQYSFQCQDSVIERKSINFFYRLKYPKYIYRFEDAGYNAPHRTVTEKNRSYIRKYHIAQRVLFRIDKAIWKLKRLFFRNSAVTPKPTLDSIFAPMSDLFFLHFLGLTTGWRGEDIKVPDRINRSIHKYESIINELGGEACLLPAEKRCQESKDHLSSN